jgi:hypothetical protein
MSIETSFGFRSAQAAWENANPYDGECTCEGEGYICDECGEVSDSKTCPQRPEDCASGVMREMTPEEVAEYTPSANCPQHGYCTGCYRRSCEDCGGEE